jgi:lipid II:glycine glycyltransferase (peptidoglycan interpeptide bridge formation enzyme)
MVVKNFLSIKRLVSLPFSDYCEPLINNADDFKRIVDFSITYCKNKNIKSFEIRGGKEYFKNLQPAYSYYEHKLDLGANEVQLFKSFSEQTRRNIKKAIKEEIQTSIDFDLKSLEEFYRLNSITRKKHGLPPQPYAFFIKIYHHLIKERKAFLISAKFKGETIASAMYLYLGKKAYYKYGASNERFQNLRPNNLVMWEAIKYFNERKYESFHFGRTEFENEGLRRFKLGWGATEIIINAYIYSVGKKSFIKKGTNTTGFHNAIFRRLPIPVSRYLSNLVYKYIG